MTIAEFDNLPAAEKYALLFSCCGSAGWVDSMLGVFPVQDLVDLLEYAEEKWFECNHSDWLEAFENHARLGDKNALSQEDTPQFGKAEQAALLSSDESVIKQLVAANADYEDVFGYMFISFAPGKTGEQLLEEIGERLNNDPRVEIEIAAAEQDKITKHRLKKLFR
ncbi:MAG TPA: 2-oxo-4-hydroxy-4-carboxy-5-ureidoimidazoline decarboxylase [Ginsengibacter sp.]|nr:2-oxo-4-hydroxy-4-carboxy-5-ureidoimidazoline decarboxylase [Chitinophagaceae bacterium]MCZ2395265.1 2-oxo-4-hydroxy-4-carboxy-5-ureidoimidazoline decarboxylase [Chitinophagales bacterium]HRN73046.1 2-oxo-4-hydroxy-4-carboxy-5-ureidoimidazoline decarboxylase [Ginsengibacter sp.]HRP17582.1 2-oxo-4-hydroxy-4-carboxy-5-ureidoimidazoline decarboxylase [Ginsengibacter sp.]HRP44583.1 2-oxo-4-hydroxy-4-carboxy-5-ureidoimidazoline decarboxylase [Ginsengibacter sp.]